MDKFYIEFIDGLKKIKRQIFKLLEENKNLKKELELVRKNTRANVETLDNMYGENVDLKKENEELKKENISLHLEIENLKEKYGDLDY